MILIYIKIANVLLLSILLVVLYVEKHQKSVLYTKIPLIRSAYTSIYFVLLEIRLKKLFYTLETIACP